METGGGDAREEDLKLPASADRRARPRASHRRAGHGGQSRGTGTQARWRQGPQEQGLAQTLGRSEDTRSRLPDPRSEQLLLERPQLACH